MASSSKSNYQEDIIPSLCPLKTVTPSLFNDKTPKNLINSTLQPWHSLFFLCSPSHLPFSCCQQQQKRTPTTTFFLQFRVSLSLRRKYMQIAEGKTILFHARGAYLSRFLGALSRQKSKGINRVGRKHLQKWAESCVES